jgi:hypothetical protein
MLLISKSARILANHRSRCGHLSAMCRPPNNVFHFTNHKKMPRQSGYAQKASPLEVKLDGPRSDYAGLSASVVSTATSTCSLYSFAISSPGMTDIRLPRMLFMQSPTGLNRLVIRPKKVGVVGCVPIAPYSPLMDRWSVALLRASISPVMPACCNCGIKLA